MSSTGRPSAGRASAPAAVEGTKTPFSTVLIVLRLTPTSSASAAWVRLALGAQLAQAIAEPFSHPGARASRAKPKRQQGGGDADR